MSIDQVFATLGLSKYRDELRAEQAGGAGGGWISYSMWSDGQYLKLVYFDKDGLFYVRFGDATRDLDSERAKKN